MQDPPPAEATGKEHSLKPRCRPHAPHTSLLWKSVLRAQEPQRRGLGSFCWPPSPGGPAEAGARLQAQGAVSVLGCWGLPQLLPLGVGGVTLIFESRGVRWPGRLGLGVGSLTTRLTPPQGRAQGSGPSGEAGGDLRSWVTRGREHLEESPSTAPGRNGETEAQRARGFLKAHSGEGAGLGSESYLRPQSWFLPGPGASRIAAP